MDTALPTPDQFFAQPAQPDTRLPAEDRLSGIATEKPAPAATPTVDEFFAAAGEHGPLYTQTGYAVGESVKRITGAFKDHFMDAETAEGLPGLSDDTAKSLQSIGAFNKPNEINIGKAAVEAFARPAAAGIESIYRTLGAGYAGFQGAAVQAGIEAGTPSLGRDIAIAPEAFMAMPHHVPPPVLRGLAADATLSDAKYMGFTPKTPEEATTAFQAAQAYQSAARLVPERAPPTIDALTKQISPDVYHTINAATDRQDLLRRSIDNLKSEQKSEAEASLPHAQEIADLKEGMEGKSKRQQKIAQEKIDDLTEKNRAWLDEQLSTETPQIQALRQGIADLDLQKRDLAEKASELRRTAEDTRFTQGEHGVSDAEWQRLKDADKIKTDESGKEFVRAGDYWNEKSRRAEEFSRRPVEETASAPPPESPSPPAPSGRTIEAQHAAIADDISSKAQAAGIPKEQADAAALLQAKGIYGFFSRLFNVSPEEFYAKHAADFQAVDKQYATKKGSYFGGVIKLFKTADVSTMVHEGSHHFLSLMDKFSKEKDAPKALLNEMKVVRIWLKLGDKDDLADIRATERAHEQFARGFEQYLREGKSPSRELLPVFEKMKQWLNDIYQALKIKYQKGQYKLSDEARAFFDRTLTEKPEHLESPGFHPPASASVHEAEARNTPPQRAEEVADKIKADIEKTAQTHDEGIANAIKSAEPEDSAGAASGDTGNAAAAQPVAGQASAAEKSGPVAASGNRPATEGGTAERGADGGEPAGPNAKFAKSKASLVDKAGNIRLDNIKTTDDIKQVMREAADRNGGYMDARRGVIPDSKVLDLADALGLDPAFLDKWEIGRTYNAEQIKVMEKMLAQSTAAVRDAAEEFARSKDEKGAEKLQEAIARNDMIQEQFSGITAEWGRAGRALRKTESLWNSGDKELNQYLQQVKGAKSLDQLQELAQFASNLKTPAQLAKFLRDSHKNGFSDAVRFYYINSLLSGPITHARYAVGNALNAIWRPAVQIPLASAAGKAKEAITGTKADRVYLGEAGAQLYAMGKGSRDGLRAAIDSWRTGILTRKDASQKGAFAQPQPNPIPGIVGTIIGQPSRVVQGIHAFFYTLRYEQEIAGRAYRQAMSEGLEGDAFANRVSDLSTSPTPEVMQAASADSLKELYMAPSDYNSFSAKLARVTNDNLPAKVIVPFAKVGINITKNAFIDQSPVGLFSKEVRANLRGENGGAARDMQIAKITAGTALMGATALATMEGLMTGDGPQDPAQRARWLLTHRPNSMQIGDITIPFKGLGSLGMLMSFASNMTETASGWSDEDGDKIAVSAMEGLTKSVFDENFMLGIKNAMDAMYHPQEYGARYLQGFATNWMPFSVGMGQLDREIDPYQRDYRSHGMENAWGILDAARARIPGLSEGLEPRVDMFGMDIQNGSKYDQYKGDPVIQRLEALGIGIGRLERKIANVPLTDAQYYEYSKVAGLITKQNLDQLIALEGFADMPRGQQIEAIHKVVEKSREAARGTIKMESMGSENDIVAKATEAKEAIITGGKTATAPSP